MYCTQELYFLFMTYKVQKFSTYKKYIICTAQAIIYIMSNKIFSGDHTCMSLCTVDKMSSRKKKNVMYIYVIVRE
jgi:hypothetical protein